MLTRINRTGLSLSLTLILAASLGVGCSEKGDDIAISSEHQGPQVLRIAPAENLNAQEAVSYRDVKWEELIPKEDLDALLNPPDYLATIAEGSDQDMFPAEGSPTINGPASAAEARYQQALKSAKIKPQFDRQQVRIPGFVVPLEFDDDQTITSFLLVPYFGACIHLPPPPPNQVIYADFAEGFQVGALYDPVNIEGELRTLPTATEQGMAAYTMKVKRVTPYQE